MIWCEDMNADLFDMIFKRKSFHLFRGIGEGTIEEDELSAIESAYKLFVPLVQGIRTEIRIVPAEETTCTRGEKYCILMYSEKKDNYLQNIGYLGEQLDLYLVSRNIGTLWFGIGKTEEEEYDGLDYVIMIAISKVDEDSKFRRDMFKSKRKPVEEIWTGPHIEGVTDVVRFAPSACNSQPWLVKNDGKLSVYRYKKPGKRGIMPAERIGFYNCIDVGIFQCILELCLRKKGIEYSRELFTDNESDCEEVLNAVYTLK